MVTLHFLHLGDIGGHLFASFPELANDFGIDVSLLPMVFMADASAASIYDDDEMLLSVAGQHSTEIVEATIRHI